jgi:nucleotide-binding universal stress UspA family protein
MYDKILVATDGSAPANRAVTHALDQAEQADAELHAIFVVDTRKFSEPALSSMEAETTAIEEWGTEQLGEVVERGESLGLTVVTRCCHGSPSEEIIRYGDEIDAELVILGYQGQSHSKTDHIGSVTDRVVQNVGRPVMVV